MNIINEEFVLSHKSLEYASTDFSAIVRVALPIAIVGLIGTKIYAISYSVVRYCCLLIFPTCENSAM